MRGKDYNTGLRGVLFDARHFARMGSSVWLYAWLVLRQTHQSHGLGWVLGGAPVCYREIEEETGFNRRTLERWMHTLRRYAYIQTETVPGGVVIRITKAKKFTHPPRDVAGSVRRAAGSGTPDSVPNHTEIVWSEEDTERIGSSSVVRMKERTDARDFHNNFHRQNPRQNQANSQSVNQNQTANANSSCLEKKENQEMQIRRQQKNPDPIQVSIQPPPQADRKIPPQKNFSRESRLQLQLLRAEREEAVRRELNVGAGPELRRS